MDETSTPAAPYRRDAGRVRRKPYAFRFPEDLIKKVDKQAAKNGVSRSWMLELLLKRGLGQDADDLARTEERDDKTGDLFE